MSHCVTTARINLPVAFLRPSGLGMLAQYTYKGAPAHLHKIRISSSRREQVEFQDRNFISPRVLHCPSIRSATWAATHRGFFHPGVGVDFTRCLIDKDIGSSIANISPVYG